MEKIMKGRNASLRREPSVAIADPTIDHCRTKEYDSDWPMISDHCRTTEYNSDYRWGNQYAAASVVRR
jgi:hypothetical protein